MKRITIKSYSEPDKTSLYVEDRCYSVSLWARQKAVFKNRDDVEKFLAEANRVLNDYLVEVIDLFTNIQTEYWKLWLYLDSESGQLTRTAGICESALSFVPQCLGRIVSGFAAYDGSYSTINWFLKAVNNLKTVTDEMSVIRYEKRDFLEIKRFNLIEGRLNSLKYELEHIVDTVMQSLQMKEKLPERMDPFRRYEAPVKEEKIDIYQLLARGKEAVQSQAKKERSKNTAKKTKPKSSKTHIQPAPPSHP